jgi:hypothetical protein
VQGAVGGEDDSGLVEGGHEINSILQIASVLYGLVRLTEYLTSGVTGINHRVKSAQRTNGDDYCSEAISVSIQVQVT